MPTTRFTVHTSLTPSEVMTLLTDFGPDRASRWPNVDEAHFAVHDQGEDWAEVTEGNAMGWERERYSWDPTAGTVTVDTLESNLWAPQEQLALRAHADRRGNRRAGHADPRPKSFPGQDHRCLDPHRRSAHAREAVRGGAPQRRVSVIACGSTVTLRMQPVDACAITLTPTLLEAPPGHRLRWRGGWESPASLTPNTSSRSRHATTMASPSAKRRSSPACWCLHGGFPWTGIRSRRSSQ